MILFPYGLCSELLLVGSSVFAQIGVRDHTYF